MKKIFISIVIAILIIITLLIGIYYLFPGTIMNAGYKAARWRAGVELKQVTINNYTWQYLDGGEGYPVIMLHGFGMFKDFWGNIPSSLTKKFRVIIPDLPGFGENTRIDTDNYNIANQVKRVKEFADKLGIKNFNLIGFSMGGGIAADFAAEYPNMVNRVILIDALGINTPEVSEFETLVLKGEKPLIYRTVEEYEKVIHIGFFNKPVIPEHFKNYIAEKGALDYNFHGKIFDELKREGNILEAKLSKIKAPTLIIWGDKDIIFDVSTAYAFGKGIPNSSVVVIPESGHMVYLEKPDESIKAINDFLSAR